MLTVGVHVREDGAPLDATLASLARVSPDVPVVLLPDEARGGAAALNRLAAHDDARIVVLLESGSIVTPSWLERLCAVFDSPGVGLAGPSTNLAWNCQRVPGAPAPTAGVPVIEAFALALSAHRACGVSPPSPKHSLSDFCYAVRRDVLEAIGAADEGFGEGPCWEMEYNARAAAAGFAALWAHGSYVHRLPIGARRREAEARLFPEARQRYQRCLRNLAQPAAPAGPAPRPVPVASTRPPAPAIPAATSGALPLVSCIMPTRDRRPFVPRAVAQF